MLQQKIIYIANCSKASIMSYNLIWLIDPDDENYCWERDWIHEILSLIKYREFFDTDAGKPKVASLPPVGEFTNNVWLREASADLGLPLNIQNTTIEKTTELEADDIDILLTNVKKLKQISKIMNTELKLQNNILDSIDEKTDNSNIKIKKINKNINKLL